MIDDDDEVDVPQQVFEVRGLIRRALERARGARPLYQIDEDEPGEEDFEHIQEDEVCQIIEIERDDGRPDDEQALVEIRPGQIMKTRTLIKTNKLYPRENKPRFDPVYNTWEKIENLAPLTCRWKMRLEYRDAAKRKAGKPDGGSLVKLAEDDVEKRRDRVSDKELREAWRGPSGRAAGRQAIQYTFGDMFCGAGGVSRGAVMAGLEVCPRPQGWFHSHVLTFVLGQSCC